ncbi:MAG: NUDIX hydrolase [Gemmataceae bacterium]|nr:NUDIX hydrolase [Gemmataceae bacterium]
MAATRGTYCYDFPRPAVTVDIAIVTREEKPSVLLIRRHHPPYAGHWALPGGFVDEGETLLQAAQRELREETAVEVPELEQLYACGDPGRDPRGWTVSIVYLARVAPQEIRPRAGDDAAEVRLFPLEELPPLAFDHSQILARVRTRLADRKA